MSILTRIPGAYQTQEQLIAALVPDTVEGRPTPRSVPLPALPALSLPRLPDPDTLLVGTACIDRSGRVHERTLFSALGWKSGHELEMDTTHGMIVIASVPGGRHCIDNRGALALPAAARRMCGITLGPPVVLAAAVGEQLLIVHSAATVAGLLAMHYTTLIGIHDAH
jgi:hypothetical protein